MELKNEEIVLKVTLKVLAGLINSLKRAVEDGAKGGAT